MGKKSTRAKRQKQLERASVNKRLKDAARRLGLRILKQSGVNSETIDEAIVLLEGAAEALEESGATGTQSSSPESGIHFLLTRV